MAVDAQRGDPTRLSPAESTVTTFLTTNAPSHASRSSEPLSIGFAWRTPRARGGSSSLPGRTGKGPQTRAFLLSLKLLETPELRVVVTPVVTKRSGERRGGRLDPPFPDDRLGALRSAAEKALLEMAVLALGRRDRGVTELALDVDQRQPCREPRGRGRVAQVVEALRRAVRGRAARRASLGPDSPTARLQRPTLIDSRAVTAFGELANAHEFTRQRLTARQKPSPTP